MPSPVFAMVEKLRLSIEISYIERFVGVVVWVPKGVHPFGADLGLKQEQSFLTPRPPQARVAYDLLVEISLGIEVLFAPARLSADSHV